MYPDMSEQHSTASQRVISLNVGGTLFMTTLSTLKKDPDSILAGMFSGAGLANCAIDPDGRFFIDRDPKHFGTILNYLRDGECDLPADPRERRDLLREAEHFEVQGLEDLLNSSHGIATGSAEPASGIPHATETYQLMLENARQEAGAGNIARAEAAIFALLFGSSLAQRSSAFAKDAAFVGMPTHKHRSLDRDAGSGIMQLGRRSVSLRFHHSSSSYQDGHPLESAMELGAHCAGAELAAFIKRHFSVMQSDFMRRGYLVHVDRASERLYMEIPIATAASAEASGTLFEGLVQSLAECCATGDGRSDTRAMTFRKAYKKH